MLRLTSALTALHLFPLTGTSLRERLEGTLMEIQPRDGNRLVIRYLDADHKRSQARSHAGFRVLLVRPNSVAA